MDTDTPERPTTPATGPLSVYSPARWELLQDQGYKWLLAHSRAYKAYGTPYVVKATPQPIDPGYV